MAPQEIPQRSLEFPQLPGAGPQPAGDVQGDIVSGRSETKTARVASRSLVRLNSWGHQGGKRPREVRLLPTRTASEIRPVQDGREIGQRTQGDEPERIAPRS